MLRAEGVVAEVLVDVDHVDAGVDGRGHGGASIPSAVAPRSRSALPLRIMAFSASGRFDATIPSARQPYGGCHERPGVLVGAEEEPIGADLADGPEAERLEVDEERQVEVKVRSPPGHLR